MQDIWSSAATDTSDWASFWANLSDSSATSPSYRHWWAHLGWLDFPWEFEFKHREELAPTDKSIHGIIGGKLRPPKLQMPKGYGNRVKTQRHEYSGPHYR